MLIKNRKYNSDLSRSLFFLIIITIVGFIIRINYLPDNIPLTLDAFRYFLLGTDISILGNLPVDYDKRIVDGRCFFQSYSRHSDPKTISII